MSMLKAEGMKSQIEQDNDKKQQALEQRFEKFKNPLGLSLAERLARLNERYSKL
jgi:division protein CdvB (Snf7/Vps24/ESCRT-III family)